MAESSTEIELRVEAALDELERWLQDLLRGGLATLSQQPRTFWTAAAARLIDGRAPELGRRLRMCAALVDACEDWTARLLHRLSGFLLLCHAFRRRRQLDPLLLAEVRSLIGLPTPRKSVLDQVGISDLWQVLGTSIEQPPGELLQQERVWLLGQQTGLLCRRISFEPRGRSFEQPLAPGTAFENIIALYDGILPCRCLIKSEPAKLHTMGDISGHSSVRQALLEWSEGLARNPWLEALCLVLTRVTPRLIEQRTCVVDTNGQSLPLEPGFGSGWELLALSGGHPLTLIGEWDGYALTPLLVRAEERWIVL